MEMLLFKKKFTKIFIQFSITKSQGFIIEGNEMAILQFYSNQFLVDKFRNLYK